MKSIYDKFTVWKSNIKRDHVQKISSNQLFSKYVLVDLTEKCLFSRKNRDRVL